MRETGQSAAFELNRRKTRVLQYTTQQKTENTAGCRKHAKQVARDMLLLSPGCVREMALFVCHIIYCYPDPK